MAAGRPNRGNAFPTPDGVADPLVERLVVAVQAHETLAVVDDEEVAEAAQPVGEDDPSTGHRPHLFTCLGGNEDAFPDEPTVLPWTAEATGKFPADRQR